MTKKVINQKGKFDEELINTIEPNFIFKDKPINRFNIVENTRDNNQTDKLKLLEKLKQQINSIENCNLKDNTQKKTPVKTGVLNFCLERVGLHSHSLIE